MLQLCRMIFVMSLEAAVAVCTVCVLRFALRKLPCGSRISHILKLKRPALAVVLHVDAGTEYCVEQLLFFEKKTDGGWMVQEYLPEDYLVQLNTEVEFVYEKGSNRMRCTNLKQSLLLGEEDLTSVLPDGEETVGITLGNLVYFSLDGGNIYIRIWPRIQVEDWPIGFYGESVLQAQVNCDSGRFRLSDYAMIREE